MKIFDSTSFKIKLMLIMLIPLGGMLVLGMMGIAEKYSLINKMDRINHLSRLAVHISDLVHEIQKERGMTAGFIGSSGNQFRDELSKQRQHVDQNASQLNAYSNTIETKQIGSDLNKFFHTSLGQYGQIQTVRNRVDRFTITLEESLDYYTSMNALFLNTIDYLSTAFHLNRDNQGKQTLRGA